jgi:hypothetical protein
MYRRRDMQVEVNVDAALVGRERDGGSVLVCEVRYLESLGQEHGSRLFLFSLFFATFPDTGLAMLLISNVKAASCESFLQR